MSDNVLELNDIRSAPDVVAFLGWAGRVAGDQVVRIRQRGDGLAGLWVNTGFEVLATRAAAVTARPDDLVVDIAGLRNALQTNGSTAQVVDPGLSIASAWQGALPPEKGFGHIDDVPARVLVRLSRDGAQVARTEAGPKGPPASLLDQAVLEVSNADQSVGIVMRAIFALTAMGFVRQSEGAVVTETTPLESIGIDEPVRVSATAAWVRIDARYGSVYFRRPGGLSLTVL